MRTDEAALLGAFLVDGRRVLEAGITADEFSTAEGQRVYQAMARLAGNGVTVDPTTVAEEVEDRELVGRLAADGAATANIPHYVERVRKAARLRRLATAAASAVNATKDATADPEAIADELLGRLIQTNQTGGTWRMADVVDRAVADWEAACEARRNGRAVGIATGWAAVDRLLGGLRGGRLYVIGARPKMGKTSLALALQHNAARAGHSVGFASAEMAAPELGSRWLAAAAGVDAKALAEGNTNDAQAARIRSARRNLAELPINILDRASVSPGQIRRQAMAWQRQHGLDLLAVDYLQRLKADDEGQRRDLTIGAMARAFKTIARDLDIPVVLLAQLSREVDRREDSRPVPSDLRDSGEIEQEADVIAFLYRDWIYNPDASPTEAEFLVRGNRHGPAGRATLRFEPEFQRWLDNDMADYETAS